MSVVGHIAVGRYESPGRLYGLKIVHGMVDGEERWELESDFLMENFSTSVRSVAYSPQMKMLAAGDDDGNVQLINMKKMQRIGSLGSHSDVILGIAFANKHILAASGDSTVSLVNTADEYNVDLVLKGHKPSTAVAGLAVHPSSKMAATVGDDRSVRLWDLERGTCAMNKTLRARFFGVAWLPDALALVGSRTVQIHRLEDNFESPMAVDPDDGASWTAVRVDGGLLFLGDSMGRVYCFNTVSGELVDVIKAHDQRVKAIDVIRFAKDGYPFVVTVGAGVTESGVALWSTGEGEGRLDLLAEMELPCRATCAAGCGM